MEKLLITLMSIGLVWLVATVIFFILILFVVPRPYLTFILAIPASCIVAIVFMNVYFKRYYNVIFVSGLIWIDILSYK